MTFLHTLLDSNLGDEQYAQKGCQALGKPIELAMILDDYDFEVVQQIKSHKPAWFDRSIWMSRKNENNLAKNSSFQKYWGWGEPSSDLELCVELFGSDQAFKNGKMNDVTCTKDYRKQRLIEY